mmetsp:Transcript_32878/g.83429  ORF Transcript_32878/g.83429 Transcript_32878/m.83429 type:complete len:369 (+) Transcript_32878:4285-5391(+)
MPSSSPRGVDSSPGELLRMPRLPSEPLGGPMPGSRWLGRGSAIGGPMPIPPMPAPCARPSCCSTSALKPPAAVKEMGSVACRVPLKTPVLPLARGTMMGPLPCMGPSACTILPEPSAAITLDGWIDRPSCCSSEWDATGMGMPCGSRFCRTASSCTPCMGAGAGDASALITAMPGSGCTAGGDAAAGCKLPSAASCWPALLAALAGCGTGTPAGHLMPCCRVTLCFSRSAGRTPSGSLIHCTSSSRCAERSGSATSQLHTARVSTAWSQSASALSSGSALASTAKGARMKSSLATTASSFWPQYSKRCSTTSCALNFIAWASSVQQQSGSSASRMKRSQKAASPRTSSLWEVSLMEMTLLGVSMHSPV